MIVLRDYQEEGVEEIRASFRHFDRVCYVLPTGGGKTITFSFVVQNAVRKGTRVVIIAHRREIVCQISKALTDIGVEHGIVAPGFRGTSDKVQVAMVQSLVRRLGSIPTPGLLVIDECHHAPAGSWLKIMNAWKGCKVLGVTATPCRLDKKGLGVAFDDLVLGPSTSELIERGALAPYLYFAPPCQLDLSALTKVAGDWDGEELDEIVIKSQAVGDAIEHYRKYLEGRPALVFCASVRGAEIISQMFCNAGIPAAAVDGEMGTAERALRLDMLADGRLKIIASCMIISEGFDVPAVAGAILLRPTLSLSLFLQQIGRALRPKEGGGCAIILDHVGNVHRHGMPDMDRVWTLEGARAEANPVTQCEKCFIVQSAGYVKTKGFECPYFLGEASSPPSVEKWQTWTDDQRDTYHARQLERLARCEGKGWVRGEKDLCPYLEGPEEEETDDPPVIPAAEGELEEVVDVRPLNCPAWAGGLSLDVTGKQFFQLLDRAGTDLEKLSQIARARKYKNGWIQHKLRERQQINDELLRFHRSQAAVTDLSEAALWSLRRLVEENPGGYANPKGLDRSIRFEIYTRLNRKAA